MGHSNSQLITYLFNSPSTIVSLWRNNRITSLYYYRKVWSLFEKRWIYCYIV